MMKARFCATSKMSATAILDFTKSCIIWPFIVRFWQTLEHSTRKTYSTENMVKGWSCTTSVLTQSWTTTQNKTLRKTQGVINDELDNAIIKYLNTWLLSRFIVLHGWDVDGFTDAHESHHYINTVKKTAYIETKKLLQAV